MSLAQGTTTGGTTEGQGRRWVVALALVVAVAAVTGACAVPSRHLDVGGPPNDGTATTTAVAPEVAPSRPRIVVIGDSNMPSIAGLSHVINFGTYDAQAPEVWLINSEIYYNTGLQTHDADTTVELFTSGVAMARPSAVFVEIGAADCLRYAHAAYDPALDGYATLLTRLLDHLEIAADGAPIIWLDIPPLPAFGEGGDACRRAHNKALGIEGTARPTLQVISHDDLFQVVLGTPEAPACDSASSGCWASDGVHLTPAMQFYISIIDVALLWWAETNSWSPCPVDGLVDWMADVAHGVDPLAPPPGATCPSVD